MDLKHGWAANHLIQVKHEDHILFFFFASTKCSLMKRGGTVRNVRLHSLKCLAANVTRSEKNALKLQIDKTRGNMSSICLWLEIFKQDES